MIYFIQCKNFVKIGYSRDPNKRLKKLQTGNPVKMKIIATLPGAYKTEDGLHEAYRKLKVRGEWFKYKGNLKDGVRALTDPRNTIEVKDVRSSQRAGHQFYIRQKANRLAKKNNNKKLKETISKL